jgi:hypothetical protein
MAGVAPPGRLNSDLQATMGISLPGTPAEETPGTSGD